MKVNIVSDKVSFRNYSFDVTTGSMEGFVYVVCPFCVPILSTPKYNPLK